MSIVSQYYYNYYVEVTLLSVDTISVKIKENQVVKFILIQLFLIIQVNTTMHAFMINDYCNFYDYFTVFVLQVINFIVSLIQSINFGNIKIRAVVSFEWMQFLYDFTHSIFLIHSHSYFITNIYYSTCCFYHNPIKRFT